MRVPLAFPFFYSLSSSPQVQEPFIPGREGRAGSDILPNAQDKIFEPVLSKKCRLQTAANENETTINALSSTPENNGLQSVCSPTSSPGLFP